MTAESAYADASLWEAPSEHDPFLGGDEGGTADDDPFGTAVPPPRAPSEVRSARTRVGVPRECIDVVTGVAALAGSQAHQAQDTGSLPSWHVDQVPGVPNHVATGVAGRYAAASVSKPHTQTSGSTAVAAPPRPKGVSQAEWDRYVRVVSRVATKKGATRGTRSDGGGEAVHSSNTAGLTATGGPRSASDGAGGDTVLSAKPVGTSDAEWARYLGAVAEAKRQSRLAPTQQTYIPLETTAVRNPHRVIRTAAEKATELGATPMAAIREFQARERGRMLAGGGAASPQSSPRASPKVVRKPQPPGKPGNPFLEPGAGVTGSPRSRRKQNNKGTGSPKGARIPLKHTDDHDDDWVFGTGLRQDVFSKPQAGEADIFPEAKSAPPEPAKQAMPMPATQSDPSYVARLAEVNRRKPGELHHNPDSDDDDLFGGAAGVF